jgi:hypothetical protein
MPVLMCRKGVMGVVSRARWWLVSDIGQTVTKASRERDVVPNTLRTMVASWLAKRWWPACDVDARSSLTRHDADGLQKKAPRRSIVCCPWFDQLGAKRYNGAIFSMRLHSVKQCQLMPLYRNCIDPLAVADSRVAWTAGDTRVGHDGAADDQAD